MKKSRSSRGGSGWVAVSTFALVLVSLVGMSTAVRPAGNVLPSVADQLVFTTVTSTETLKDWYDNKAMRFRQDIMSSDSDELLSSTFVFCDGTFFHVYELETDDEGEYVACKKRVSPSSNCRASFEQFFDFSGPDLFSVDQMSQLVSPFPDNAVLNRTEECHDTPGEECDVWVWTQPSTRFCDGYYDTITFTVRNDQDMALPDHFRQSGFTQNHFLCLPFEKQYHYSSVQAGPVGEEVVEQFVATALQSLPPCSSMS